MWAHGFRYCFTPLSGCFSPFPHGTGSLSVIGEYSALEGGPPCFAPDFTCPALLGPRIARGEGVRVRGLHPVSPACPGRSAPSPLCHRAPGSEAPGGAGPRPPRRSASGLSRVRGFGLGALSLAATRAISFDFSSSGYLDVSVPPVASLRPMYSGGGARAWPLAGSPIRESPDRRPFAPPRGLSQLAAPFVDFRCQGIRRAPSVSCSRAGTSPARRLDLKAHDVVGHEKI